MIKDLMFKIKSDATDKQLIDAVKKHNEQAFTIIYNRYSAEIIKHLKIKTSYNIYLESAIDDIVSETFVTLWENIINGKYETQGYLKAYLQKIAFFKMLKIANKNNTISRIDEAGKLSDLENEQELSDLLDDDIIDYKKVAEEALNKLKEICLQIIIFKYYDKMSDAEIYTKFKDEFESVRNIRSRRSHCMEKLRKDSDNILKKRH